MADRQLRVSAVAGDRRSDLVVPDGVALAELVPDLARSVGLLDPAAVYEGYRVTSRGRPLTPALGLGEQGVGDGALLAVAAVAHDDRPPAYDDLADATAEAVQRERPWGAGDTRQALLATGAAALLLAACCGLARPARHGCDLLAERGVSLAALAAVALVLVVLAGSGLPAIGVAIGVGRSSHEIAPSQVGRLAGRSTLVVVVGSAVVALLAALAVPAVARSGPGAALAADCGLVLLLRARRPRAARLVGTDVAAGVLVLVVTSATVAVAHADRVPVVTAATAGAGVAALLAARAPAPPAVLRARVADLVETVALVALVPLLVLATDVVGRLGGA